MKELLSLLLLSTSICLGGLIEGVLVPDDVAFLGGSSNRRPNSHFEIYAIVGVSSRDSASPVAPIKGPFNGIFVVQPGDRKVAIRIKASSESGLPSLKDGKVEIGGHFVAGRLYAAKGTRDGDVVTVWLQEMGGDKRVSTEVKYDLRREIFILIPIH